MFIRADSAELLYDLCGDHLYQMDIEKSNDIRELSKFFGPKLLTINK